MTDAPAPENYALPGVSDARNIYVRLAGMALQIGRLQDVTPGEYALLAIVARDVCAALERVPMRSGACT